MKIGFAIFIFIHGLIHLMGFVKAFQFAEIEQLTQPISRFQGVLWLLGALLFAATIILFLLKNEAWWMAGIAAIILSQVLIFLFWKDAKFGTIANLVILIPVLIALFSSQFDRLVQEETEKVLGQIPTSQSEIITQEAIEQMPPAVQLWLNKTGIVGKEKILSAKILQQGKLRTTPDQKWMDFTAKHIATTQSPAFIWKADVKMNPLFFMSARDKFVDGKGEMLIKLLSLFNVVNAKGNEKINQGSLQRYLAEAIWYPTAAFSPYIQWEPINETTVKATMTYKGTTGSGIFHFHEDGTLDYFQADRYKDTDENAQPEKWHIQVKESKDIQGLLIPTKADLAWKLSSGDFKWMELEVVGIEFNGK